MVAVAQPGRAPDCGSGCRGFKSRRSPHPFIAPVAQLDRASVFGTEGWGFKSLRAYHLLFNLKIVEVRGGARSTQILRTQADESAGKVPALAVVVRKFRGVEAGTN